MIMENYEKDETLKATESAPMDTKQRNDIGVRNQTTKVPTKRFPWTLTIIVGLMLAMVGLMLLFLGWPA